MLTYGKYSEREHWKYVSFRGWLGKRVLVVCGIGEIKDKVFQIITDVAEGLLDAWILMKRCEGRSW